MGYGTSRSVGLYANEQTVTADEMTSLYCVDGARGYDYAISRSVTPCPPIATITDKLQSAP